MTTRSRISDAALAAALLLGPAAPLLAAGSGLPALNPPAGSTGPLVFEKSTDFQLFVDGAVDPAASLYRSQSVPGLLVISPQLGGAWFTRLSDKKVVVVNPVKMLVRDETLLLDQIGGWGDAISSWAPQGSDAVFSVGGKAARIQPLPILVGKFSPDEVVDKTPSYAVAMAKYQPDPQGISYLKSCPSQVEIEAYFGSWCHVCKQYLPQFLRTIKDSANPNLHVTMFGLSREFGKDDTLRKDKGVNGIPCIILYKEGREIGRIEGPPKQSYEKDLSGLIRLASAS